MVGDEAAMEQYLRQQGRVNFLEANAAAGGSRPWFLHRKYGGWEDRTIADASPSWQTVQGASQQERQPGEGCRGSETRLGIREGC